MLRRSFNSNGNSFSLLICVVIGIRALTMKYCLNSSWTWKKRKTKPLPSLFCLVSFSVNSMCSSAFSEFAFSRLFGFFLFLFLFFLSFCYFFGPLPRHMEVPSLGVESEPYPPTYTRATATQDPSRVCDLHHSSRQRWIFNPLSKARDWTLNLMVHGQIC